MGGGGQFYKEISKFGCFKKWQKVQLFQKVAKSLVVSKSGKKSWLRKLAAKYFEQNCARKNLNDDLGIKKHVPGWVDTGWVDG